MPTTILTTKLQRPPMPMHAVPRSRLTRRLAEASRRRLTLVCAPAGFGKTTLVNQWLADEARPVAWLSLDDGDNDPSRFLAHLVAALRTIEQAMGVDTSGADRPHGPPPVNDILTDLINEVASVSVDFVLVLDDYHVITAAPVDAAVAFLLEHLPSGMHVVIGTREDPHLPLARYRARGQSTEVRAADLCFLLSEAAELLEGTLDIELSPDDVALLVTRTEGWATGLQLAATALQGHRDPREWIRSFSGVHRFVQDYFLEEVLQRQPATVQAFLLRTSILGSMCGPLCDAVLQDDDLVGQDMLEALERANVFIVPLDDERRWYRYHHPFADVLRRRLHQGRGSLDWGDSGSVTGLHERASRWYEDNGFEAEAFQHVVAADEARRAHAHMDGHLEHPSDAPARTGLDGVHGVVEDGGPAARLGHAADQRVVRVGVPDLRIEYGHNSRATGSLGEPLTSRELQVLRLVAEGLSNSEIGHRMFRSLDTVKGHNRRLFEKLGVRNRTQAIARAQALHLL